MTEAQIRKLVTKWQKRLGLSEWHLMVKFDDTMESIADCEAHWRYLHATVRFNLPKMDARAACQPLETHELTVVHELTHVLLAPLDDAMDTTEGASEALMEYTTEIVSRAFVANA